MNESKPYYAILDEMRRSYHMTVKQICDYTGFSERTYQRIQQGKASPTVASFCRWWAYLHLLPNPGVRNRVMQATNFPITSYINNVLDHLRLDSAIAQPEAMRAKLNAFSQRYMQDDFQILLKLLDLRTASTKAQQAVLAKLVITQLKHRHFWTDFETQCFLIVEPYLGWAVVSHCMMRYLTHLEPQGELITQLHFRGWHELLLIGYIKAAAKTRIFENVAQTLVWGRGIKSEEFEGSIDNQIIYALIGQLATLFQSASPDGDSINKIFKPIYHATSELAGGVSLRVITQLKLLQQILVTSAPYHHDRHSRQIVAPFPIPYVKADSPGQRLDQLRQARQFSIKELCEVAGFSRAVYRRFCTESSGLRIDELCRALDALRGKLSDILMTSDFPFWPDLYAPPTMELMHAYGSGSVPKSVIPKLERLHAEGVRTGNPLFLASWYTLERCRVEIERGDVAAGAYGRQELGLMSEYDTWYPGDYCNLQYVLDYADVKIAQRVMKRLIDPRLNDSYYLSEVNLQMRVVIWLNLLSAMYKTGDAAAIIAVTGVIRHLELPTDIGDGEILWCILQRYCRYIETAISGSMAEARAQWTELKQLVSALTPNEETPRWIFFRDNQQSFVAHYLGEGAHDYSGESFDNFYQ